jgi:hypothetical protein
MYRISKVSNIESNDFRIKAPTPGEFEHVLLFTPMPRPSAWEELFCIYSIH